MATDYPIEITDPDGSVRIAGLADFIDPDNAPAPTPNQPGAGQVFTQDADPGAVGAGAVWVNTATIAGTGMRPVSVRNAVDNAWIPSGLANYVSGVLRGFVTIADDGGIAIESLDGTGQLKSLILITNTVAVFQVGNNLINISSEAIAVEGQTSFTSTVLMGSLPTADPHALGELYTTDGALFVSAG